MSHTNQKTAMLRTDYRPLDFNITTTNLNISIDSPLTTVRSKLELTRTNPQATSFTFDGRKLELLSVKVNGKEFSNYQLVTLEGPDGHQQLKFDISELADQDHFTVEIENTFDLDNNLTLGGIYKAGEHICSQCEAESFRQITFYFDRPDNLSVFTVRVEAAQAYKYLLSNGNLLEQGELDNGRHFAIWHDPFPKPCYLFALVAGDFDVIKDHYITKSGRRVELRIFAEVGKAKQIAFAMDCIKRAFKWDEQRFGLEYDLDLFMIVAVSFFNMGAMENKGLNIFNDSVLLGDKDTAPDLLLETIDKIIGHEYFHNWTGDRVTCRDWFQLTLKEGLTVFRDQEYSSDTLSRILERLHAVKVVENIQFVEDQGPTSHPIRPDKVLSQDNFYTPTVYRKGAEIIRMIHTIIGEANFQQGMKLYFKRHDGQAVTCDDFVAAMADASGVNLDHFKLWYSQSGTPEVTVTQDYDATSQVLMLTFSQRTAPTHDQKDKQALYIPLKTHFLHPTTGQTLAVTDLNGNAVPEVLVCDQDSVTYQVKVPQKPVVVTNLDFSAPIKLNIAHTLDELSLIAAHADNKFARYQATQQAYYRVYQHNLKRLDAGQSVEIPATVLKIYDNLLSQSQTDAGFYASLLTFTSPVAMAATYTENLDPVKLDIIYSQVQQKLSQHFKNKAKTIYNQIPQHEYAYDVVQFGHRSLRKVLLILITANGDSTDLVVDLFKRADNLTDRLTALTANYQNQLDLEQLVTRFLDMYQDNANVMDMYNSIVASYAPELTQVLALTQEPTYSDVNPNRVRGILIPMSYNYSLFYRQDGVAMHYLASEVLRTDKFNPQLAARIIEPLLTFYKLTPELAKLNVAQLQLIADAPSLSSNLAEKVTSALAMASDLGITSK